MYAKSEATVANILDAAETLFVARNFTSVSMQDIADGAAVTKGALYHHFKSKEDLYVTMMCRDLEAKRDLFAQAIQTGTSAHERLGNLTSRFFDLPSLKRRLIQLVRRDINFFNGANRARIVHAYQAALPDQVEGVISDGMHTGELIGSDSRLLAWSFVALVEVVLSQYAGSVLSERERVLAHVLDLFFSGAATQAPSR
jgi:AcrR family transcriptional regulator